MLINEILACPRCGSSLAETAETVHCTECDSRYPVADHIPCFAEPDPFYDRYSEEHCPYTRSPRGVKGAVLRALPFWSYREWRFWRQAVPLGGRLLDIGAGRGKEIFVERAAETVGVDGSLSFLRGCREHYDRAVLASLPRLPFRDRAFDTVVSSHVLGHIPHQDKETLVAEIARVLRPGGTAAFIIETDSASPYIEAAKQQPELYQKSLIEQDGHVGLETTSAVLARFARHGLRRQILRAVDMLVPSVMYYEKYLAHDEYADLPRVAWTRALRRVNGSGTVGNLAYEVGFGAYHRTVEQWLGNKDHANFIHVSFVRA